MSERVAIIEAVLKEQGGFYTMSDILDQIDAGAMQSFAKGDSWLVTRILDFPRRTAIEVVFAYGDLDDLKAMESEVEQFRSDVNADCLLASGRMGWKAVKTDGWKYISSNYIKEY